MPFAVYILFGAALTVLGCWSIGSLLLHKLGIVLYRQERQWVAFLCGAPVLSTLIFVLTASQALYKGTVLAVVAIAVVACWRTDAWRGRGESFAPLDRKLRFGVWFLAAPFLVITFFHAMAPEMSPDGSAYHLGLVARYYREHGFHRYTLSMYGFLSQGLEMLFLSAYAFGRHSAAALVHWCFLITLPMLMLAHGRRFGYPHAGLAGALFCFFSPVVGIDGASAYNDVAVACVLFGVFHLIEIWVATRQRGVLVLIGLLAGFAFAIKYTAFLALPYALARIVWALRKDHRPWLKTASVVCALALIIAAPWPIKNALWTANPVAPFFNQWFPNPYVTVAFEREYGQHMRNYDGLKSHWDIPLEITARGHVLCGLFGPLFLLSPLALLALRSPIGRRLLLAFALFASVYAANIGTRFLIPALPFLALALALAFARVRWLLALLVLAHAISSWPDVIKEYSATYAWRLDRIWWKPALRIETEEGFLARLWPTYTVSRLIDAWVPAGERVFTFNQVAEAYTSRDVMVVYQSAEGARLGTILWTPLIPEYKPTRVLDFQFPPRELQAVRLVQTAAHDLDQWHLSEIRLYSGKRELTRDAKWRLRAHPFPWTVQLAFDNSELTKWQSNQSLFPGMYVEVRFGARQMVDRVWAQSPPVEQNSRVRLEGLDSSGAWSVLAEAPVIRETPPPLGLRRAATGELKRNGIRWFLTADGDFATADFAARRQEWGATLVSQANGVYLYRFE
ncbi:MAG: glycosyltransferase family 39 protein [Acidobacteriota bacterium]